MKERNLKEIRIDIILKKENQNALLTIGDNAGGIADENLSKIFDPYFTTKHQSIGTGLGLYIARMIIEDTMSGSLKAQNFKDGAIFNIRTPYIDAD